MSNVISFSASPLAPFLGEWKLDPLSVSRNKVMKGRLGNESLKNCGPVLRWKSERGASPKILTLRVDISSYWGSGAREFSS